MTYKKSDVELYEGLPSVNVKVHGRWDWQGLVAKVASDELADERFTVEFVDDVLDKDEYDDWFTSACEQEFEMAQQDAEEIFSDYYNSYPVRKPILSLRGRSGGHLTVDNLPPIEEWDAIRLRQWHKFDRLARAMADDVPYIMVSDIYHNAFLPWADKQDAIAAEDAAALLPIDVTL